MKGYTHRQTVVGVVNQFVGIAEAMLALRIVLRFFNGNPDATFVHWVYTVTAPLLEPFRAIFTSSDTLNRGWVIDFPALFAMAGYALIGYLILTLLARLADKKPALPTKTTTRRSTKARTTSRPRARRSGR
jgi:uncharacterized protein YggT (Ycf19 family)